MNALKDEMLRRVHARARREAERLASEFAHAAGEEREMILAALEIERWLAQESADCLATVPRRRRF
jgi:hypothetical protein